MITVNVRDSRCIRIQDDVTYGDVCIVWEHETDEDTLCKTIRELLKNDN